jgi:hypothetical protein
LSVDGISCPAVLAPGTRALTVFSVTPVQGAGATVYFLATAVAEGPEVASCVFCGDLGAVAAGVVVEGLDDMTQPVQASTATGNRRAVRASGRGRECTAHFSWGTVGSESTLWTERQCHMTPCGAEVPTRSVAVR